MQNRYVGDVGDFAKYALLRALAGRNLNSLRVGLVWCLVSDETHNGDGRHVGYLRKPGFRALDPILHDGLAKIVNSETRSVALIEQSGLLPRRTVFFDEVAVHPENGRCRPAQRVNIRSSWLGRALAATSEVDLVFFDPDNGIEVPSVSVRAPKAEKYVFWDELLPFWSRGQSLLIYNHLNRRSSAKEQTEVLREKFVQRFADPALVMPLLFRRGSCRHFWIVGQRRHANMLETRARALLASGWDRHFDVV
jgi:hypothetical protein